MLGSNKHSNDTAVFDLSYFLHRAYNGQRSCQEAYSLIDETLSRIGTEQYCFAIDGGHKHRGSIREEYKQHRDEPEPEFIQQKNEFISSLISKGHILYQAKGFEADDVMATIGVKMGDQCIIVSPDKDMVQMHGICKVYNAYKQEFVTDRYIAEKWGIQPHQMRDLLALMGDAVDGVPGIKGIGPKIAAELLAEYGDLEAVLSAADEQAEKTGKSKWKKIAAGKEDARKSRDLVQLITNVKYEKLNSWSS